MTDIIKISTENEQPKTEDKEKNIKDILKQADEYQKLKEQNDKLEREILRQEELNARASIGGKSYAGQPNKTEEEIRKEQIKADAAKLISTFR